jgi:ubiquitin C-terminal hydrolase
MNAVLQALAHAPELCMAIQCEPHYPSCPVYQRKTVRTDEQVHNDHVNEENMLQQNPSSNDRNFCILCEMEQHLIQVHKSGEVVSPSNIVHGFINHIAPWFKLGVQEDSHEFLRLLIEAMEKSCVSARRTSSSSSVDKCPAREDEEEVTNLTRKPLDDTWESVDSRDCDNTHPTTSGIKSGTEYPFRLFCGEIESTVKCSSCSNVSSKIDPIEDIGLEVRPSTANRMSWQPTSNIALMDVMESFQKFTASEALDACYKCESCGKVGKATKQVKLKSIPPILTLHLKRFRYGNDKYSMGHSVIPSRRRTAELSGLLGDVGSSGSAKIEGHVKFPQVFDIRPYLTQDMQSKVKSMLCRLFAVIVHSGKNSHSGHYVSYVRNVSKNEWWKMDDARVTLVSKEEVFAAEAYMLFYRVVDHPVSVDLKNKEDIFKKQMVQVTEHENSPMMIPPPATEPSSDKVLSTSSPTATSVGATTRTSIELKATDVSETKKRKRDIPEFKSGEEWARKMTTKPKSMLHFIRAAQDYLCERIEFKPEYLNMMKDEVESGNRVQNGPSFGISLRDDVLNFDILDGFRHALWSMFQHVLPTDQSEIKALLKPKKDKKTNSDTTLTGEKKLGNFSGSSAQTRMNHARGIEHEYDVGSKNDTALPEDTIKKPPNKVISVLEHNDSLL